MAQLSQRPSSPKLEKPRKNPGLRPGTVFIAAGILLLLGLGVQHLLSLTGIAVEEGKGKILETPKGLFGSGNDESEAFDWGTKQVLVPAKAGAAQVKKGDTIRVYYKGTFMDPMREPFDSNLSGPGFTTKIGVGQVIKGWDLGMPTMKVGEKALLTIASAYAYGPSGAGGTIGPNEDLKFEVEILEIIS